MNVQLELPQVTVCAIDTVSPPLAARALSLCTRHCAFGDAILISNEKVSVDARFARIDPIASRAGYSEFVIKTLYKYISTPFALIVQWDGYIVDHRQWTDEFLDYDYVGALWHWSPDNLNVGNGGFSLRSRRLLELLASPDFPGPGDDPEDHHVCRTLRPTLEADHGIRFATREVAERFAYECSHPEGPTFGFHGLYNIWRHAEDAELSVMVDQLPDHVVPSREFAQLLRMYYIFRKFVPLTALYRRLRRHMTITEATRHLVTEFGDTPGALACVKACEAQIQQ